MKLLKYLVFSLFILSFKPYYIKVLKITVDLQNKITKNLRCLICQGQSVYDSDSEFAL